jgi:SAM-dependent methyltransferase
MEKQSRQYELRDRTIADFGDQWTRYADNEGHYGSIAILADTLGPLLPVGALAGKEIAEIGSGTGRIVRMLLAAGAKRILAIEPSKAVELLRGNLAEWADRVEVLQCRGEEIPVNSELDYVLSIGVIHHIPEPKPVLAASFRALRPGGRLVIWVYGREGNRMTVATIEAIRAVTIHLPHAALALLCHIFNLALDVYLSLCRWLPLPLRDYMRNVIGKFNRAKRYLVIYDQFKPAYAKYYTEVEVRSLFVDAGFVDVRLYHRRGYSWTVIGTRPVAHA